MFVPKHITERFDRGVQIVEHWTNDCVYFKLSHNPATTRGLFFRNPAPKSSVTDCLQVSQMELPSVERLGQLFGMSKCEYADAVNEIIVRVTIAHMRDPVRRQLGLVRKAKTKEQPAPRVDPLAGLADAVRKVNDARRVIGDACQLVIDDDGTLVVRIVQTFN